MPDQKRNAYDPPLMTMPGDDTVTLEQLRYVVQQHIGAGVAQSLHLEQMRGHILEDMALRLEAGVLAEELPPVEVTDAQRFTVPRFASPWQHFKARYRDRWWMWLLRDFGFMHEIRYVDEPHTHTATVAVRTYWTYPRSNTVLPGNSFGHPVLKTQTSHRAGVRPW